MNTYLIKYVREEWLDLEVQANSEKEAYDNFVEGLMYDESYAISRGSHLNEDISIELKVAN